MNSKEKQILTLQQRIIFKVSPGCDHELGYQISDIGYRISDIDYKPMNQLLTTNQPTNQPPSPLSLISMPILFIILLFLITKKKLEVNLFYESIELHSLEKTIPYYTSDWLIDLLNKRVYTSIHLSIHHLFTSPKTIIQTKTRLPKYLTTNNDKQPKDNNNKKKETKSQKHRNISNFWPARLFLLKFVDHQNRDMIKKIRAKVF